jgi:predicted transcriptional regulator
MRRKIGLGRAESEVLRYVADRHPITVRDVAEHFAELKGQTKTTLLNVMERLREKGFLTREPVGGVYHYSPAQPKARMMRDLVRDFVDDMLGGSLEPFAAYLTDHPHIDEAELARLKAVIAELEMQSPAHSEENGNV